MIRAIIFDCFGVLTSDGWHSFKVRYFGNKTPASAKVSELRMQVDGGYMDYREFVRQIAEMAGVSEAIYREAVERNAPNDELFEYIEERLVPAYQIGLLSNAGSNRLQSLFGNERTGIFDEVALSFETGSAKPHQQAYAAIAQKLGVQPEECIFVDDQERYCTAARDVGMQAIVYHDFEQCRDEIERLLSSQRGKSYGSRSYSSDTEN